MSDDVRQAAEVLRSLLGDWITYAWLAAMALWGGVVRVIRQGRLKGKTWREIVTILSAELTVSAFAGTITFYACESAGFDRFMTALLTSIAGYMGGQALDVFVAAYRSLKTMPKP